MHEENLRRDSELFSIFSPKTTNHFKTYPSDMIGDGLFESTSSLKTQKRTALKECPKYDSWTSDFKHILEICKYKCDIPPITLHQSTAILNGMKPTVPDFWSITPFHFCNAGEHGQKHFNYLMNRIISEVSGSSAAELNVVLAHLFHKSHGKTITSERSYRTILSRHAWSLPKPWTYTYGTCSLIFGIQLKLTHNIKVMAAPMSLHPFF